MPDERQMISSERERIKKVYTACIDLLQNDPQHGEEYEDDDVNEIYAEAANFVNAVYNLGYDFDD